MNYRSIFALTLSLILPIGMVAKESSQQDTLMSKITSSELGTATRQNLNSVGNTLESHGYHLPFIAALCMNAQSTHPIDMKIALAVPIGICWFWTAAFVELFAKPLSRVSVYR